MGHPFLLGAVLGDRSTESSMNSPLREPPPRRKNKDYPQNRVGPQKNVPTLGPLSYSGNKLGHKTRTRRHAYSMPCHIADTNRIVADTKPTRKLAEWFPGAPMWRGSDAGPQPNRNGDAFSSSNRQKNRNR